MKITASFHLLYFIATAISAKVNPLPEPRDVSWSDDSAIKFNTDASASLNQQDATVSSAFDRFKSTLQELKWYPAATEAPISKYQSSPTFTVGSNNKKREDFAGQSISSVNIHIDDYKSDLQLGVNETYTLEVKPGSVDIHAATRWGALHAITTLQQIVIYDSQSQSFYVEHSVKITDAPLYPHRGLMIDTSRNFLSLKKVKEQIDIMSLAKMNSLHWHITDSQSWPVEIKKYPKMTDGAYSPREVYTQDDIKDTVKYAKDRGVRIIPEVDMPGHSRAGYYESTPEILACADSWWGDTVNEPVPGQLEVLDNKTYEVVGNIYNELTSIFDDDVFHVGADEVKPKCYKFSKSITEWFAANKSRTYSDLTQLWFDNALPIFNNSKSRRLTMWEDARYGNEAAHELPTDVIMQSWAGGLPAIKQLTNEGYDVIVSTYSFLYLDCGFGGFLTNDPSYVDNDKNSGVNNGDGGSWCAPYKTWQRIYDFDITGGLNDDQKKHILGAEAALWSELADDTNTTPKIWPRLAALAESTWSGNRDKNNHLKTNNMGQRIINFRE